MQELNIILPKRKRRSDKSDLVIVAIFFAFAFSFGVVATLAILAMVKF